MTKKLNYYFIGDVSLIKEDVQTSTIDEAFSYLKDKKIISLDIETTRKFGGIYEGEGLKPHLTEIVMVQIGTIDKQFVIDYRNRDLGELLTLLTDPSILIVGQNIKFEYLHFLHNEGIRINNVYDTMITEQVLYNGLLPDASLKGLNQKYLGIDVDKSTRLEFLNIKDRPFTLRQIEYGAQDILYPLLIREYQLKGLEEKGLKNCFSLEMAFIECLGDIEYKGMHFNKEKWYDLYLSNKIKYEGLKEQLDKFIVENYKGTIFVDTQQDLFSTNLDYNCRISWSSPKQTVEFFRYLGICPMEKSKTTGKMAYTVNANVLKSSFNTINKDISIFLRDFLELYINFKETKQSCTTFGEDFFKYINPVTNRLHSNYRQILNTGRISSSGPNLQNIPSDDAFRSCFTCPEGWKIVNADYGGQETVILANVSGEKNMLKLLREGGDMHVFVTKALDPKLAHLSDKDIKKDYKEARQISKSAGFAIQFGGNGYTISSNLGIPQEEGDAAYDAYFRAFPDLKDYFDKVSEKALRDGYVLIDSITGRKRFYIPPKNNKERHTIYKMALNAPIQGTAGSMTKFAAILMRRWIFDNKLENDAFITNLVHDEINVEAREEIAEQVARALEVCMNRAADKWCKEVPLTAEAVVTTYWNH